MVQYAGERKILFEPQNRAGINFGFTAQDGVAFCKEQIPLVLALCHTFHMNIEDTFQLVFDERLLHYLQISDSNRKYPGGGHVPFRDIISHLLLTLVAIYRFKLREYRILKPLLS